MCDRMGVLNQLQGVMSALRGSGVCGGGGCGPCCGPKPPCCCGGGSLLTVYNAVLAVGQPPRPVCAFDKAIIAVGRGGWGRPC